MLWVLALFLHVAGIFLLLSAEFLAAVQVLVYAGAILVFYLFVLMLLDLSTNLNLKYVSDGRLMTLVDVQVVFDLVSNLHNTCAKYLSTHTLERLGDMARALPVAWQRLLAHG